jgi:hypothetical protein
MENVSTNLYNRARVKNGIVEKKPLITHKLPITNKPSFTEIKKDSQTKLPIIASRYMQTEKKEIVLRNNNKLNPLKGRVKNYTAYLKENYLHSIQFYLDPMSMRNFILTCSKFYRLVSDNDELWYFLYTKKYNTKKALYDSNRGKWRSVFFTTMQVNHKTNYETLKAKYLKKVGKNSYQFKKDVYYVSNNLYSFLKPIYSLELDGKPFRVRHVLTNKTLSHINLFANFDQEYIDLKKLKTLRINVTESNLGVINRNLVTYDIQKKKFKDLDDTQGKSSKICKIYYDRELTVSTFNTNLVFFLNISIPICKVCEGMFDFMKGIHDKNLDYFDDVSSKFGLYDYALLLNIKSWKSLYFSVNVNTLDFKEDNGKLYYENDSISNLSLTV